MWLMELTDLGETRESIYPVTKGNKLAYVREEFC